MRAVRLFVLMLLALSAFGPRCAVAAIGAPAAYAGHSGHAESQQHRSHHDGAACEGRCVGCAVAPLAAARAGGPYIPDDAPDPVSAPAANPVPRIASLDPPPPRTA